MSPTEFPIPTRAAPAARRARPAMPKTRTQLPSALALALAMLAGAAQAQTTAPAEQMPAESAAPVPNGQHTLNLKQADIGVLIQTVSEITGRNFIIDPRVEGKVTVVSAKPMDADGIYEVFLSVLRVHGYAAVPAGSMVKILPDSVAFQEGAAGLTANGSGDSVVTRILELKHVRAAELLQILRPLLPQTAQLIAHKDSNALVVTDRYSNIERLKAVLARIDTSTDASVEVIPLSHASASEVARTLSMIDGGEADAGGARIIPDPRTNTLLLSGDPSARLRLRALVTNLDTPLGEGDSTQVVYIRYADAEQLVPILEASLQSLLRTRRPPARKARPPVSSARTRTPTRW
jgi:general secretion pathway protein D